MGDIYYKELKSISVPADATCDVWSLFAGATRKVKLHGWELSSADIAAEIVALNLHRITAVGSGGSAPGGEEMADELSGAITATVRTLDTTPGTDGGGLMAYQWEQLGPVGHVWTPEMRPVSKVSEGFALTWLTAAAATVSGYICWEEI